jgi:tRNA 2-thiouridine synthesizing protein A
MSIDTHGTVDEKTAARYLDCRDLRCPLPIVKISRAFKEMSSGQTLLVEANDPAFKSDLEAWVRTMGHELLEFSEGSTQQALLRKSMHLGKRQ